MMTCHMSSVTQYTKYECTEFDLRHIHARFKKGIEKNIN